jgi:hypothetical protein
VVLISLMALVAVLAHAPAATAALGFSELGLSFTEEDGSVTTQAGSHPFAMSTTLRVDTFTIPEGGSCDSPLCDYPEGELRNLTVELPPGLAGNPFATPRCSPGDFAELNLESFGPSCPNASAVGLAGVRAEFSPLPAGADEFLYFPVYNLEPPPGVAAKLGFYVLGVPVTLESGVSEEPPYLLRATLTEVSQALLFYGSELILWGTPAASAHDPYRGTCLDARAFGGIVSLGECPVEIPKIPFLTLPRSCEGPLTSSFVADSWEEPGVFVEGTATTHGDSDPPKPQGMTGCSSLEFGPELQAQPSATSAESPTGLDFTINVDDEGINSPTGVAQSDIRKIVAMLPPGVTANPSAAEGLGVCTKVQYEAADLTTPGCPSDSKLGSVSIETPILEDHILRGSVFLAQQDDPSTAKPGEENPFDSFLALYVLIRDPELGIFVAQPVKVEPDEQTGQLSTIVEDLPQFPLSKINLRLREGPRAPLITPPTCGTYTTKALLTPWSGAADVTASSTFEITSGPGGGSCPVGVLPFSPGFTAGSINNNAGSHSPFYMRLTRRDGDQEMTRFDSILPSGVTGVIAGVPRCSDVAIAEAKGKSGRQEMAFPSCPSASRLGHVLAGAGVGPELTYVPGQVYLAGPYGGAPLSIAVVVPAVAGPFDAGTVVTREALDLDPNTAEVIVDGAASDPIPHILKGIPLKLRDLQVFVDRPNFMLNPTGCDEKSTRANLFGSFSDVLSPADDAPVALSSRYQAANCSALGFAPKLSLKLRGGTRRGDHPSLRSVLTPKPGHSNIRRAVVALPPSEFIDNAHIQNPCTRVQFNADQCPPGSILGTARAFTPLLEQPLEGPVYFRSNGGERVLPDIVADLRGEFRFILVGFVDAKKGRIRTTFATAPDAPVSKFVLNLKGGKRGLLVNNRSLCKGKLRARVRLVGHNGKVDRGKPLVKTSCKERDKKPRRHSRR